MIAHLKGARRGPAAKAPAKAKAKTKGRAKAVPPKATVGKPAKIPKEPSPREPKSVHVERSVSHVLARTGLPWFPKSKASPYKTEGGIEHAKKLAWKLLNEVCPGATIFLVSSHIYEICQAPRKKIRNIIFA